MKYTYTIQYRLDDINDIDNTEYIDGINTKVEARKQARAIIKEYGNRVAMLDIMKYDEDGCLEDAETLI